MKEYEKIETIFERDMEGTKKLIEGNYRNKTVQFIKDCWWQFTEKIDGTNIRVCWNGHEVEFRGRTDRAQIPKRLAEYLDNTFATPEAEQMFEQLFGDKEVILFGEGYGAGIQKGGNYRPDQSFILFDVCVEDLYLERHNVEDIATAFGIDVVPIVLEGDIDNAIDFVRSNPDSTMGTAKMEGVVGRPSVEVKDRRGNRIIVKIKYRDFC